MNLVIEAFRSTLAHARASDRVVSPAESILFAVAGDLTGMADAYIRDSRTFQSRGDLVNALAAVAYAAGWRDLAISLGLVLGSPIGLPPASAITDSAGQEERFREKAVRYARLLGIALNATRPAPEAGTIPGQAAGRYRLVAEVFLREGTTCITAGANPPGLFYCSYGHAWLDAGVRAGLFRVTASREIFTI